MLTRCLSVLSVLLVLTSSAQVLPDSVIRKIDRLFSNPRGNNNPGFTVGVVRNDSLIFSRGYGMANMEYGIPNSPETIYHMASVSKQFTAYAILLLERQGRLKLEDDVRKYLRWFPDLKEKITIRQLLNHTSGIRDQWDLNVISGRRMDDVITQDYLLTLLSRQQDLNFKPGDEYSYSNSNFTMAAEIVRSITGQSFRQFADSAIFKPLGMRSTHVHDDHTEVVPNRAYSYRPLDSVRYANAVLNYANAGATSLFTNIPDMAKWVINFYNTRVGDASTLEKLTTRGILNNGVRITYALGIGVDEYNGKRRFSHGGADAGYRTFVSVFPDEKMGFIVFSNLASANPAIKANELADIFIKPVVQTGVAQQKKADSSLSRISDTTAYAKYMGNYIAEDGVQFSYKMQGNQVYWTSPAASYLLARIPGDTLVSLFNPDIKFVFSSGNAREVIVDQYWPDNHRRLKKYSPASGHPAQVEKELKEYVGTYYSPEADVRLTLFQEGPTLLYKSSQSFTGKTRLEYIARDHFRAPGFFLKFVRNAKDELIGYHITTGRTRHLVFNKINANL